MVTNLSKIEQNLEKVALGGGCHWCTEAIFQSLKGVSKVEQGFVVSKDLQSSFSEAVIVHYHKKDIDLKTLITIHLHTHKSTSKHSMREKYRSAVYYFSEKQKEDIQQILAQLQVEFDNKLITKALPFSKFKASRPEITNYYYSNPKKPFCQNYIDPKLKLIIKKFSKNIEITKFT